MPLGGAGAVNGRRGCSCAQWHRAPRPASGPSLADDVSVTGARGCSCCPRPSWWWSSFSRDNGMWTPVAFLPRSRISACRAKAYLSRRRR